jgi:hypothetical protein
MNPSEIQPANFWFVAQCFNQLRPHMFPNLSASILLSSSFLCLRLLGRNFSFNFPHQKSVCIFSFPSRVTCTACFIRLDFITLKIICEVQIFRFPNFAVSCFRHKGFCKYSVLEQLRPTFFP